MTKIFLASMDTAFKQYKYPLLPNRYFLSYFYKRNTEAVLTAVNPATFKGCIFCDSGAHSFFGSYGIFDNISYKKDAAKKATPKEIEEYFERYFSWILKWQDKINYFAELDLQEIVGIRKVMEWRKRFMAAGVGNKMVMATHTGDTWKDFVWMLDNSESRFVATQGLRQGLPNLNHKKYVKEAYMERVRVHGFAMTKREILENIPFYSVDSSSWTSCWKFGTVFKYEKGRLRRIANAPSSTKRLMKFGMGTDLLGAARSREEVRHKALRAEIEWRLYEEYIGSLWRSRGVDWEERLSNNSPTRKYSEQVY